MNTALAELYALQQVDTALADAQRRYAALDPGRAEQAAFDAASADHATRSEAHQTCAANLHDAELELKSVEQKRKAFEGKLYGGKVSAFKELESMQQEIEALTRQRARLDERILTYMDEIETRRADEEASARTLADAKAALEEKQATYAAAARELASQIRELTAKRAQLATPIAPALMRRYEAIRATQHGVGVARLDDRSCGACHTTLPVNTVRMARESQTLQTCDNCGRLLFAEES